jgi:CBS domain-containing protein
MSPTTQTAASQGLILWAETAADLMMSNPMSIRGDATVREAIEVLTDHGFSAAPVIDEAGRAIGVVSRADILVHDREKGHRAGAAAYYGTANLTTGGGERLGPGFHETAMDETLVRDIMTPAVFSVAPNTPATKVVEQMIALAVHRLYVVEEDGTLVGVITALDVLRHMRPKMP